MPAPQTVVEAVQAAILASAHLAAYEQVAVAANACQRLGRLSSGRWRASGRDLATLAEDLQRAVGAAAEALTRRADELGVPEDTLWTVGDAAGTLELLREAALEEARDGSATVRILRGELLFGVSFVEDAELPDRGTTLLFAWPEPLSPATWPWQANWVIGNGSSSDDSADELDLYESGEMEGDEALLAELSDELSCSRQDARDALRATALALTRASLLAATADDDDEDDDEEPSNGDH